MVALDSQPRESGRRSRGAAEQRRRFHFGITSLLRSSGVLCADDLRFHRRLPHAAAPQRIANRYLKNLGKDKASRRWKPGLTTTSHQPHFRPPTGFMPVDARFDNFADGIAISVAIIVGIVFERLVGGLLFGPAARRTIRPMPEPAWPPSFFPGLRALSGGSNL